MRKGDVARTLCCWESLLVETNPTTSNMQTLQHVQKSNHLLQYILFCEKITRELRKDCNCSGFWLKSQAQVLHHLQCVSPWVGLGRLTELSMLVE